MLVIPQVFTMNGWGPIESSWKAGLAPVGSPGYFSSTLLRLLASSDLRLTFSPQGRERNSPWSKPNQARRSDRPPVSLATPH